MSTVPPVMVRVTADHTALAIVAADGTFGLFVSVSTVPPVMVRVTADHTALATSTSGSALARAAACAALLKEAKVATGVC